MREQTARFILDHLATGMWVFLIAVWSVALLYLLLRKKTKNPPNKRRL
ncbi:MAG: hypothetical protein ACYCYP_12400 [Leptospirales bacterium]